MPDINATIRVLEEVQAEHFDHCGARDTAAACERHGWEARHYAAVIARFFPTA